MTDVEIFAECQQLSIMGRKLHHLIRAARTCTDVPGSVCEVGVYRGGSGLALCRVFDEKQVYMVDTFSGVPEDDVHESGHRKGDFNATSCADVLAELIVHGVRNHQVFQGDIRTEYVHYTLVRQSLAFIHLDADIEQSTRAATDLLLPRLSPQGGVFFDDYGHDRCPGVKIVVDELMATGRYDMQVEPGTAFLKLIA